MADSTLVTADGTTFRVEQDYEEYLEAWPQRDPEWRATDSNGHEHYMQDGGYPTLEWVVTGGYWCEMHNEEHEEGEWRCRQCGEAVSPGMRPPDPWPKQIPGMRRYFINDEPVAEAEFQQAVAKAQRESA